MNTETKKKPLDLFHQLIDAYDKLNHEQDAATRNRRLRVFNDGLKAVKKELAKDEKALLQVLNWEYERGRLPVKSDEWYQYNALAVKNCTGQAEVHNRIKAGRFASLEPYFQEGKTFKYRKYFHPGTGKNYFTFFWDEVIPAEHRIKPEVQKKMKMGIAPTQDDYLPDLVKVDSHTLREDQFFNHFRVVEEMSLEELVSGQSGSILDNAVTA